MDVKEQALQKHYEWRGKIEVVSRAPINTREDLSLAYTPGVAQPCLEIEKDESLSYTLTRRGNMVAVITDGTAVLGLGDIGPAASMPVMEGKCALFKAFADVDAFPVCIDSKDVDTIVNTVKLISKSFGGINLEDISAPRCFEIERRLKEECEIPVFHDDQHGTAIIASAALLNAEMAKVTNHAGQKGSLAEVLVGADVFIGVSRPGLVTREMVGSMADKPIVFAMANPVPEIMPEEAKAGGAAVIGTGRSDYPNQINNVLAFPGIFKGALAVRARGITEEMKVAAAKAIAEMVSASELSADKILPDPLNKAVADRVAQAVAEEAVRTGTARISAE